MPRSASPRSTRSPVVPKPTISSPSAPPSPGPTLGQSIKDGFGFGVGSAIAHRIIGPAPVVVQHQQAPTSTASSEHPPEYIRCMKESFNDAELCKEYLTKAAPNKT